MEYKVLLTVFISVFIAELGDKTQLATMLFAADKEVSKLTVFFGASLALIVASGIGVLAGGIISQYVSEKHLQYVAGDRLCRHRHLDAFKSISPYFVTVNGPTPCFDSFTRQDIHLDSPLRGLESYEDAPVDEIRNATRRAFDNLVALAIEEEVRFVLLAGDLYDGDWKDYNTGLFFTERMGRLKRHNILVFMVSGNHDAASRISPHLHPPDNVTVLSTRKPQTILLEHIGAAIHGQGYASRAITHNLARHYPQYHPGYFNIGLLHTALNGREGHEPYAPCSLDDLKSKGYDYWALGHVHQREVISRDPWILFPGNLQGRHIRETGSKGASLITVENGRVVDVTHHDLDVLRFSRVSVDLSRCTTIDAVHDPVREALETAQAQADERVLAVRLELTGETSASHPSPLPCRPPHGILSRPRNGTGRHVARKGPVQDRFDGSPSQPGKQRPFMR